MGSYMKLKDKCLYTMPVPASPPFLKEGQGWFVIFIELTLIYPLDGLYYSSNSRYIIYNTR